MENALTALVIDQMKGMKSLNKASLLRDYPSWVELRKLKASDLKARYAWKGSSLDWDQWLSEGQIQLEYCRHNRIQLLFLGHEDYPEILRHIYDPPFMLFVRGKPLEEDFSAVAVVGTRKPSGEALSQAFQVGLDLALRECAVVSGLAIGIDGAAHRGALAGWGHTLAVLPSGVDRIYPKEHRTLAWEMLEGGGSLISEYWPGTEPSKYRYPQRNRIISGLSIISVVIQAPAKSGALITADFALQEGRDLCVGSTGLDAPGSHNLAEQGATVISRGKELLDIMGVRTPDKPGSLSRIPKTPKGWIEQLEKELRGDLYPFQGDFFHGF